MSHLLCFSRFVEGAARQGAELSMRYKEWLTGMASGVQQPAAARGKSTSAGKTSGTNKRGAAGNAGFAKKKAMKVKA